MDSDEREICNYLKSWAGQWVSAREIARRAGGKHKFREDPHWVTEPIARLIEKSVLESDTSGHYRLKPKEKTQKAKQWISPELKKILEESGKKFQEGVQLDAPEDFYDR